MYYDARWYDPSLGRFAQADTVVPVNVQGYDRYAYTNNNPVRYIDPSGHCIEANGSVNMGGYPYGTSGMCPNSTKPKHTFVVITCGVNDGSNCACPGQPGDPLASWRKWAEDMGFSVLTFDVDACGKKKADCYEKVKSVVGWNPSSDFYFVGHSAGADVSILGANYMVRSGKPGSLKGVVLLEPSVSWTPTRGTGQSLENELTNIMGKTKIFVGTSANSDDPSPYLGNRSPSSVFQGYNGKRIIYGQRIWHCRPTKQCLTMQKMLLSKSRGSD